MSSAATWRWLRVFAGLAVAAPLTAWGAVWFAIACYAVGGRPGIAAGTIVMAVAVGVLIWRWPTERRDRAVRMVLVSVICLSVAVGSAFGYLVSDLFSGSDWSSL